MWAISLLLLAVVSGQQETPQNPVAAGVPLRLAGGASALAGRLEVQLGGRWGSICGTGFTAREARVACARMGLTGGAVRAVPRGNLPVIIAGMRCKGNERQLADCNFQVTPACPSRKAAGVACSNPFVVGVRLQNSESWDPANPDRDLTNAGRLEVQLSGGSGDSWGTVCDTGFGDREAQAVCRMLGKLGGRALKDAAYGPGQLPILLDRVACTGREANLTQCKYSTATASCTHARDVSVECQSAPPMPLRLVSNANTELNYGRLEVQIGGQWGTVCRTGFTAASAQVVCTKLGLRNGELRSGAYGRTSLPTLLADVRCTGRETELSACSFGPATRKCTRASDVGVRCHAPPFSTIELYEGPAFNTSAGHLRVGLETRTVAARGTICGAGWTAREAQVACRNLGMSGGRVLRAPASAYLRALPMLAANLRCKGDERVLSDCSYDLFVPGSCKGSGPVGIACDARPGGGGGGFSPSFSPSPSPNFG